MRRLLMVITVTFLLAIPSARAQLTWGVFPEEAVSEIVFTSEAQARALLERTSNSDEADSNPGVGSLFEVGMAITDIDEADRDGDQIWVLVRQELSDRWELMGRFDHVRRFDANDTRISAGAFLHWLDGKVLRMEMSGAPFAELFPRFSTEVEYIAPIREGLAGYLSARYSDYAGSVNFILSMAAEYYFTARDVLFGKVFRSFTLFDAGDDSANTAVAARWIHYFSDSMKSWVYYANGSESYLLRDAGEVGVIDSHTYAVGGTYPFTDRWSMEGSLEWLTREHALYGRFVTLSIGLQHRF